MEELIYVVAAPSAFALNAIARTILLRLCCILLIKDQFKKQITIKMASCRKQFKMIQFYDKACKKSKEKSFCVNTKSKLRTKGTWLSNIKFQKLIDCLCSDIIEIKHHKNTVKNTGLWTLLNMKWITGNRIFWDNVFLINYWESKFLIFLVFCTLFCYFYYSLLLFLLGVHPSQDNYLIVSLTLDNLHCFSLVFHYKPLFISLSHFLSVYNWLLFVRICSFCIEFLLHLSDLE